jgi:hypothetical protein
MNSYFMQREGGRLFGIAKTSQQEYGVTFVLNDEKTCRNPMRTFLASLAKSVSKLSSTFHASPSDECPLTPSFLHIPSLCHLVCLTVLSEKNNHFN